MAFVHRRYARHALPAARRDQRRQLQLEVVWRFKTDNLGNRPEFKPEGTALMVHGILDATGGSRRAAFAMDADPSETPSTPASRPNPAASCTRRNAPPATAPSSPAAKRRPRCPAAVSSRLRNGLTLGDLFERTRTTMPPGSPGRVTRQQHADILAYILSVNRSPAASAEIEPKAEVLRGIQFEAEKK
jgi:hypothetical protein